MPKKLSFEYLLTANGLISNQSIEIDHDGRILGFSPAEPNECIPGLALPGMPNAHSHCFQRAMVGFAESKQEGVEDSFWSWREHMYKLANRLNPDQLYIIACQSFTEMLQAGFTSVAEFHYIHRSLEGEPTNDMADAVIRAAKDVGIRMRLLPVLYIKGGFNLPAQPEQFRFVYNSLSAYCDLLEFCKVRIPTGIAPHSLRAVPVQGLPKLIRYATAVLGEKYPIHMHIAEQKDEVKQCLAAHQVSPIQLLADTVALTSQWNLVHATHVNGRDLDTLARMKAQVVLCPLTEAYLGDGVFPAQQFVDQGGRFAIGSDSNTRIDPFEELRLLEYGQRLMSRKRLRLSTEEGLGKPLWERAALAGAKALMFTIGQLQKGHFADITVLDTEKTPLASVPVERMLDAAVIGGSRELVKQVYVGGELKVDQGRHTRAGNIESAFKFAMRGLNKELA